MSSRLDWDYGICAYSEFTDGILGVGVDLLGSAGQSGRTLEPIQPLGLLSRPMDPVVDPATTEPVDGAGAIYGMSGSEGFVMPTTDPRLVAKIPQIGKGSTVLYSNKAFLHLDGTDDNATVLYQPVGDDKGQAFSMSGKVGEEDIQIRHATGAGYAIQKDGKNVINNAAGDAYIEVGPDGIVLNGNVKINGGVALGEINSARPLAKHDPYAAALTAIQAALAALVGVPANSAASGAVTAAGVLVGVASAPGTGGTLMVSGT